MREGQSDLRRQIAESINLPPPVLNDLNAEARIEAAENSSLLAETLDEDQNAEVAENTSLTYEAMSTSMMSLPSDASTGDNHSLFNTVLEMLMAEPPEADVLMQITREQQDRPRQHPGLSIDYQDHPTESADSHSLMPVDMLDAGTNVSSVSELTPGEQPQQGRNRIVIAADFDDCGNILNVTLLEHSFGKQRSSQDASEPQARPSPTREAEPVLNQHQRQERTRHGKLSSKAKKAFNRISFCVVKALRDTLLCPEAKAAPVSVESLEISPKEDK